ncbi:acetylornithine transaminase [Paenactinomyces guangxiensis]|uniref:Acetylornithine aminotransferase n=1 Tax=Paenactinomyces guangxiensis TaxID=1490290 RepID=A0A7W2A9K1_9BACL|nr:acetylornithine transaminase [Paenactinomyces guangxiensis]MBA4495349.1 acetylornithine transaminase [Paenactinomyces guangxiensis]MBH8592530.1 acetylornithine transaminase [Paenactinomyces guangxiensis]
MSLFPTYLRHDVEFVEGRGAELIDENGKRYLDFGSGIGVTNLGHCHPRVTQAVIEQAQKLWHTSNLFSIPLQEEVSQLLCEQSGMGAVFFCNSGAEANEAAIKLARKWAKESKIILEPEILTFEKSFHGRTLATLTATGQNKVKKGFDPLPGGFRILPCQDIGVVKKATGSTTAAVLLELVQGEGGVKPADIEFVQQLAAWCKQKNILLIIDEVQTGIGRTGDWFAFQAYKIRPDVVTLAKGLGNGFPVGAMMAREKLKPILGPGSHGTTFGGNPLAMAAAKAVLQELKETTVLGEAKEKGEYLFQLLSDELADIPEIKEIRCLGLMAGIQLHVPVAPVIGKLLKQGMIALPAGENVLRLLPPLVVTKEQIKQAVSMIKQVFSATEAAGNGLELLQAVER